MRSEEFEPHIWYPQLLRPAAEGQAPKTSSYENQQQVPPGGATCALARTQGLTRPGPSVEHRWRGQPELVWTRPVCQSVKRGREEQTSGLTHLWGLLDALWDGDCRPSSSCSLFTLLLRRAPIFFLFFFLKSRFSARLQSSNISRMGALTRVCCHH